MKLKLVIVTFLGLLLASCSSEEEGAGAEGAGGRMGGFGQRSQRQEQALSVRAYQVSKKPISLYTISNTTFEAVRDVTVFSRLNAIIAELRVEEGSKVRRGQLLARLDEREIRNDFEQSEIAVAQSKVNLEQAEVRAELSKSSYERAVTLFEQKLTSRQDYDQAELASRTDSLALTEAAQQLQAAEARLEASGIQLEYTKILSPINGVVTERLKDVGDRINVNEAFFSVQEFPPLWARIYVPERSLPQLKIGQVADLRVETYPDQMFQGRIKMISPTIDPTSGTVKVTIEVNRPGNLLRPGMFGTVFIATETHPEALVIPKKSIVRERDQSFLFVINQDGTVSRRELQLGFSEESDVEVLAGIQEAETIVTVGVEALSDGYPVQIQSWEGGIEPEGAAEFFASATPAKTPQADPASPQPPLPTGAVAVAAPSAGVPSAPPSATDGGTRGDRGGQSAVSGRESARGGATGGNRSEGGGRGGGRGADMFDRLLSDPEIKKAYEERLKKDPELATDQDKRRAFAREFMAQLRQRAGAQ